MLHLGYQKRHNFDNYPYGVMFWSVTKDTLGFSRPRVCIGFNRTDTDIIQAQELCITEDLTWHRIPGKYRYNLQKPSSSRAYSSIQRCDQPATRNQAVGNKMVSAAVTCVCFVQEAAGCTASSELFASGFAPGGSMGGIVRASNLCLPGCQAP